MSTYELVNIGSVRRRPDLISCQIVMQNAPIGSDAIDVACGKPEMLADLVASTDLRQAVQDRLPSGFEHFYPTPPDLEQIVIDAMRYRYLRSISAQDWFGSGTATPEHLDAEIDKAINKEQSQ